MATSAVFQMETVMPRIAFEDGVGFHERKLLIGRNEWHVTLGSTTLQPLRPGIPEVNFSLFVTCAPALTNAKTKLWRCESLTTVTFLSVSGMHDIEHTCFHSNNFRQRHVEEAFHFSADVSTATFDQQYLFVGSFYKFLVKLFITRAICVDLSDQANRFITDPTDGACFSVDRQTLWLSRSLMSYQTPFFRRLLDALPASARQPIVLGCALNDFMRFLAFLFPPFAVDEEDIAAVLDLATLFHCDSVSLQCEGKLLERSGFTKRDLIMADQYRLGRLRKKVVQQLPIQDLEEYIVQFRESTDKERLKTRLLIMERLKE